MIADAAQNTTLGKAVNQLRFRISMYHLYMVVLNILALMLAVWDPRGILLLVVSIGYSLHLHLGYKRLQEQRYTNELLSELMEELLAPNSPPKPLS